MNFFPINVDQKYAFLEKKYSSQPSALLTELAVSGTQCTQFHRLLFKDESDTPSYSNIRHCH